VREELARVGVASRNCAPTAASASAAAPAPPAVPAVDRETQAAVARAHDILDRALATGSWTENDRTALRSTMTRLPKDDAEEIHRILFPALNDGRLKSAFKGTPL
jgi:hypothetical protein